MGSQEDRQAAAKPLPKLRHLLGHDMVHVLVGKKSQDFSIHKDLICYHSPYFKASFGSGCEETKTGFMRLPETNIKVFTIFYHWLYEQEVVDMDDDKNVWPDLDILMELYVFADMARVTDLKNDTLTALVEISNDLGKIPSPSFKYVWENTTTRSPIRRLIVDWVVWELPLDYIDGAPKYFPAELIKAVMKTSIYNFRHCLDEDDNPTLDPSNYHEAVD